MHLLFLNPLKTTLIFLLVIISSWGLSKTQIMQGLDNVIIDSFTSLRAPLEADNLAIIAIDSNSLVEYGYWPWSRSVHAKLVDKLTGLQVEPIIFDILFSEVNKLDLDGDKAFYEAIKNHGKVVLATSSELNLDTGSLNEFLPTPLLLSAAASVGHTNVTTGNDGVSRSIHLNTGVETYWPALALAGLHVKEQLATNIAPNSQQSTKIASYWPSWIRSNKVLFPLRKIIIPTFSYYDVLSGKVAAELEGKTVFVGMNSVGLGQVFSTPAGTMNGVEFQANIFYSLEHGTNIIEESQWRYWLGLAALSLGGLLCLQLSLYHSRGFIFATLYVLLMGYILLNVELAMPMASVWVSLIATYLLLNGRRLEHLDHISQRDELTGLLNRRQFDIDFEHFWQKNQRGDDAISLLLLDIDFFKRINDNFGHAYGDEILAELAKFLLENFRREQETIYRVGGEEFAILMQERDVTNIKNYAEDLVEGVEKNLSITLSIGYVHFDQELHVQDKKYLYEQADRALYKAKELGRNRAVSAEDYI